VPKQPNDAAPVPELERARLVLALDVREVDRDHGFGTVGKQRRRRLRDVRVRGDGPELERPLLAALADDAR
jgi:hypothetical protein